MAIILPFSLLPPRVMEKFSRKFSNLGIAIAAFTPSLKDSLLQAEYEYSAREYAAMAFASALINCVAATALVAGLGVAAKNPSLFPAALLLAFIVFCATFFTTLYYPQIISTRKTRRLEMQLIPATRQLLIEVKSGVPLFNAMASISSEYGEVSKEFSKMVQKINSGTPELEALADASTANPSHQFRRVLWQISNALKVGSDVGKVLELQIEELTRERVDQIRRYGQELSPWTMIYMMASVIIPSLGVTMLIVIVGFLDVSVPKILLGVVLAGLVGFQLFFMNFVNSRRPAI